MSYTLFSADSHVNPLPSFWSEYLPVGLRDLAPRLETTAEGTFEVFEGQRKRRQGLAAMAGKKPEEYALGRVDRRRETGWLRCRGAYQGSRC